MKRLLDVSVSILVVIALFMSQSWAVTAAYADYSIDGSDDSNSFHLEGSTSNQAEPISGGQESDAGSVDSEPQDAQQVLSGETNEAAAADSASNDQLTVKNVSVSAHVQNIGWMDPVSSGKVAGTTGRGLNLEALKISLEVDGATSQEQIANAISVEAHVSNVGWQAAVGNRRHDRPVPRRRGPEGQAFRGPVGPLHRLVPRPLRRVRLAGLGVRRRRRRLGGLRPRRPGRPGRGPAQGRPRPGRHYLSF